VAELVRIDIPSDPILVDAGASQTVEITITNTSSRTFRAGVHIPNTASIPKKWVTLTIDRNLSLKSSEAITFPVTISPPENASTRAYSLALMVFDQKEPGERFVESASTRVSVIALEEVVPRVEPKPRRSWKMTAVVGVASAFAVTVLSFCLLYGIDEILDLVELNKEPLIAAFAIIFVVGGILAGIAYRRNFSWKRFVMGMLTTLALGSAIALDNNVLQTIIGALGALFAMQFYNWFRETSD